MKLSNIVIVPIILLAVCYYQCDNGNGNNSTPEPVITLQNKITVEAKLNIETFHIEKENYSEGDNLKIPSFSVSNESEITVIIKSLKVRIKNLSVKNASFSHENTLVENRKLKVGEALQIQSKEIWTVPKNIQGAYGIYINTEYTLSSDEASKYNLKKTAETEYKTFVRIAENPELNTFNISRSEYFGLPVYQLTRGLSAEYAIQKAVACLDAGTSHSWSMPLGPINSTPQFLKKSIRKTIDFYNQNLGATTPFETVVISTGIPSAAYLAGTMNAPLLPFHFLVGAETVKEVKTILDYSNTNGYSSYAALGHDYSISTTVGVAWIKLLDIPQEYIQFMLDHNVKNIVFMGSSGTASGEVQARKVIDGKGEYDQGSIYLMHFAGSSAEIYLRQTIRDFDEILMGNLTSIADWESGIITAQVNNFTQSLKNQSSVNNIHMLTSNSDVELWNLGAYVMLSYLEKNKAKYENSRPVKGVSLNPYLIGHPLYESRMGYIPFLYWQGINADHHIDTRLNTFIKTAVHQYFPDVDFGSLKFWVNSTHNFGGSTQGFEMSTALKNKGYSNVIENNFLIDETWKIEDGINSPVELRAKELLENYSVNEIRAWKENMQPLLPDDLQKISQVFNQINFVKK